jgi:hypothetical protein
MGKDCSKLASSSQIRADV